MSLFPQPGPLLPSFKTLLIKGDYHASAPVHLALSHLAGCGIPDAEAVIITPAREAITHALYTYRDSWLATNSDCGDVIALSARVKIYYPPSPAHLCLLLSMFRVSHPTDVESGAWINSKTTLAAPPSILIIHEPSSYFLSEETGNADPSRWTVSSYLGVITHGLSSSTFLSSNRVSTQASTCFALFDSLLDRIKLPILNQPEYQEDPSLRLEPIAPLVQKYFEWMVVTDPGSCLNIRLLFDCLTAWPERDLIDGDRRRKAMKLYRLDQHPEVAESWEWWETLNLTSPNGHPARVFVWGS